MKYMLIILAIFLLTLTACDIELVHDDHDHDGDGVQDHAAADHDDGSVDELEEEILEAEETLVE